MYLEKKVKILLSVLFTAAAAGGLAGCETAGWNQSASVRQISAAASGQSGQGAWEDPGQPLQAKMISAVGTDVARTVTGEESYMAGLSERGLFMGGEAPGGAVLEDQDFVYFYSGCEIRKISNENQEVSVIWKSSDTEAVSLNEQAVLTGDRIFFMENWWARGCIREILSVINTDGTGYERMEERKKSGGFLYFSDGILYVEDGRSWENGVYMDGNSVWEYGVYTDGTW